MQMISDSIKRPPSPPLSPRMSECVPSWTYHDTDWPASRAESYLPSDGRNTSYGGFSSASGQSIQQSTDTGEIRSPFNSPYGSEKQAVAQTDGENTRPDKKRPSFVDFPPADNSGFRNQNQQSVDQDDISMQDEDMDICDTALEQDPNIKSMTAAELRAYKRKLKRFRLTHGQTRYLMSEFAKQPHPDITQRERLADEIPGLSPRQVQVWFQNRRAKMKRLTTDDRERVMRSRALPANFDMSHALHSPLTTSRPKFSALLPAPTNCSASPTQGHLQHLPMHGQVPPRSTRTSGISPAVGSAPFIEPQPTSESVWAFRVPNTLPSSEIAHKHRSQKYHPQIQQRADSVAAGIALAHSPHNEVSAEAPHEEAKSNPKYAVPCNGSASNMLDPSHHQLPTFFNYDGPTMANSRDTAQPLVSPMTYTSNPYKLSASTAVMHDSSPFGGDASSQYFQPIHGLPSGQHPSFEWTKHTNVPEFGSFVPLVNERAAKSESLGDIAVSSAAPVPWQIRELAGLSVDSTRIDAPGTDYYQRR